MLIFPVKKKKTFHFTDASNDKQISSRLTFHDT